MVRRGFNYIARSPDTLPLAVLRAHAARDPGASWVRLWLPVQETYLGRLAAARESWEGVQVPWTRMSLVRDLVGAGALPIETLNGVADQLPDAMTPKIMAVPLWAKTGDTARLARVEAAFRKLAAESPPEQREFMADIGGFLGDVRRLAAGDSAPLARRLADPTEGPSAGGTRGFRAGSPLGVWIVELSLAFGNEEVAWDLLQSRAARTHSVDANLWRLHRARLAERRGEREMALEEYAFIARLWRDADEPLRSLAVESRDAVARLTDEPR